MTIGELVLGPHAWAAEHTAQVLVASTVYPILATVIAWLGRGGRTDRDGVLAADAALWGAALVMAAGTVWFLAVQSVLERRFIDMELALLVAPLVCFVGTWFGVTRVFPFGRLRFGAVMRDLAGFLVACAIAYWFLGQFRGWGIVFFGGIFQLLVFAALGVAFVAVLARRLFRSADSGPGER